MNTAVKVLAIITFVPMLIAAYWWAFRLIFNVVVHDVFGGPSITYWQAAACAGALGVVANVLRGKRPE